MWQGTTLHKENGSGIGSDNNGETSVVRFNILLWKVEAEKSWNHGYTVDLNIK